MVHGTLRSGITIKMLDVGQSEAMFDFIERNRAFFVNWIPFVSKTAGIGDVDALIARNLARYAEGLGLFYTLWDGPSMIAYVLAREINREAKWAEIGYMIDEAYAGRGIVKDSCIALMRHLFHEHGMDKIVICCAADNEKSKALAARLGFTLEGTIRNHFVVNGTVRDMLYYGLLQSERSAL